MREQEPVLQQYIDLLITKLREKCGQQETSVDIVEWYNFTTFDIIGHLAFGESFDCLKDSAYHQWVHMMFASLKFIGKTRALNRLHPWLGRLAMRLAAFQSASLRQKFVDVSNMSSEKLARRAERQPEYTDFMTHLLAAKNKGQLEWADLQSNAAPIVIAGSETTATLLSGATFYLLTHRPAYEKLKAEVRGAFKDDSEITVARAGELPYLLAVLDESLRMYPPGANAHLRRTPPEGAMIDGKFVPGGLVMGMNQYAVHRSELNFARADEFAPERWINVDEEPWKNDQRDAVQPFSYGPRNCIGRNLAYHEMRLILTKLVRNFDMELMPESNNWLDQDVFIVWEKHPLFVKLKPVDFAAN